ncbi:MAG: FAD binding domain-containing protein [Anaerolineae bacterium]|nr:FAD binding domain-containing protein [Anaerolineae bacterium]
MWQHYYTPASVYEALMLLAGHQGRARLIAGGTDLIIELERGIRTVDAVIDVSRLPGLDTITVDSAGDVHLGSLVTHNQVAASEFLAQRAYPLARACWEVGAPQIRNRGTIAGNLITASPANDTITPLCALDASLTLESLRGRRVLALRDFFRGVRRTALADDEMLTDIQFHPLAENERGTFIKLGLRQAQAISVVNVAAIVQIDGERVAHARLALGSVAPTIVRARESEAFLMGKRLDEETIARAGELAVVAARPIDDIRGSTAYRREMVRVLTMRALRQLRDGTERATWPQHPVMLWGRTDGHFPTYDAAPLRHDEDGPAIEMVVNGRPLTVRGANGKTLLRALREDAGLIGTKEGCAEGECGACTVWLDGLAVMACMVPAPRAHGCQVTTVEGLAKDGHLHPIQQAFITEGAVQCGYCTPGLIMAGANLWDECPHPTVAEAQQAITGNLCRCTGYAKVVAAMVRAEKSKESSRGSASK